MLYLTEAVDEYCLSSLPEYDGKKFQNIAKEIFDLEESEYLVRSGPAASSSAD